MLFRSTIRSSLPFVATLLLAGCGSSADVLTRPALVPVTGQVSLDDEPLADAELIFVPIDRTEGIGGKTRTNSAGEFDKVLYLRGGEGLPKGTYRVSVSKRILPDGTPVPPGDETPPIESPAKETIPRMYSNPDEAKLQVTVEEGKPIELKLQKS